ncbi:hypothetical protein [Labrenzia sp. R5_0]|nr:hypothetical protein [Labrenzia sp. R5_0]
MADKKTYSGVATNAANGGAKPSATAAHWEKVADSANRKQK